MESPSMKLILLIVCLNILVYSSETSAAPTTIASKPDCSRIPTDIVFAIDESGSVDDAELNMQREFMGEIIHCFNLSSDSVRIAMVSYAKVIAARFDFNEFIADQAGVQAFLATYPRINGGTFTHQALKFIREEYFTAAHGARAGVKKIVLIITDGESKFPDATKVQRDLFNPDVEFFVFGIGPSPDTDELENLASDPDVDHIFQPKVFEDLMAFKDKVVSFLCPPCDPPCQNGGICVRQMNMCNCTEPWTSGDRCQNVHVSSAPTSVTTRSPAPTTTASNTVCDDCHYVHGIGYLPHPTDCNFYIQCFKTGLTYREVVKQCPTGLYWNQVHLTCDYAAWVNCTTTATVSPAPVSAVPTSGLICDGTVTAVPGNPSQYARNVYGHGWLTMNCAPGTVFDSANCTCVHGGPVPPSGDCKAELYLPFNDTDVRDHSGNQLYVENNGVVTNDGEAIFTNGAFLRIPYFSNMDFGYTLRISFILRIVTPPSTDEVIVTNAGCNKTGSIYIGRTTSGVFFRVLNESGFTSMITVPLSTSVVTVSLTINNGLVTAVVGGVEETAPFQGRIGKVHCALQIGRGTDLGNFNGILEDFKLFRCIP